MKYQANEGFISRIEAIRELRDKIIHRDFIQAVSSRRADGNFHNYVWVDKTVNDILKTLADEMYQSQHQCMIWKLLNFPEKPDIL